MPGQAQEGSLIDLRRLAVLVAAISIGLVACDAAKEGFNEGLNGKSSGEAHGSEVITQDEFGSDWPFAVREGTLRCSGTRTAGSVTFEAEGRTYALNGTARSHTEFPDVDPIWAADPSIPGAKKNIGSIIERGLQLCTP